MRLPWKSLLGLLVLAAIGYAAGPKLLDQIYPEVALSSPTRGPAVQAVYATGVVEPVRWARVGPVLTGRITSIEVVEGNRVQANQVLAKLDDRETRARVNELEAKLKFLQEQGERYAKLRQTGVASQSAFDQITSDLNQTRFALAGAQKKFADMVLRAPLSGVVLRRDAEPGETVREGQTLFWIGETNPLWLVADVDEDDIPRVQPGQKVLIKSDAFPGRELQGKVAEITLKGDPVQKSYRVRISLPTDTPLLIGMTAEVNIVLRETNDALLIPTTALRDGAVFLVEDGRAARRPIKTGAVGGRLAEVREGLEAQERIITNPPPGLAAGTRLRIAP